MEAHTNPAFIGDNDRPQQSSKTIANGHNNNPPLELTPKDTPSQDPPDEKTPERDLWGKEIEFLLSCIAMSVGLGNVWRFPFTALENGGGAFLIPYLIVLLLVGKPLYYIEMIIGQFSSRGACKVYDLCPAMRGIGYGQVISIAVVSTYYASLMGLTIKYFLSSFQAVLPWSVCNEEWATECIASSEKNTSLKILDRTNQSSPSSSAELYFIVASARLLQQILQIIHREGIGYGQTVAVSYLLTYYSSLMALICRYILDSFDTPLPWSTCWPNWPDCIDSAGIKILNITQHNVFNLSGDGRIATSSELYFTKEILKEKDSIDDGIGYPNWQLVLCLIFAWVVVYLIIIRGIKSSGKASYFLAIFPYVVLGILLIRALTLPGSFNGILYFIKPQWDQILNPKVWYAAVTQVFFSLSVCFGNIIMYASYNKFGHNVHRDATIVTILDTFTSLLSGCTIFGILGHLAHEIGTDDIGKVVKGGTGLAFISYPDAIAKFETLPQAFSVLFFAMLFVLGVGSNIAMTSCVMTSIRDNFPKVKHWQAALGIAIVSIFLGLAYVTPGGQFILNLVDYFGASIIALVLAIAELVTLSWIYGVNRICQDAEFMIGKNPNIYWRICWGIVTPILMTAILIYTFVSYEPLKYRDYIYPDSAYAVGWCISAFGILQVPIWACVAIIKHPGDTILDKIAGAFKPKHNWGPTDPTLNEKYKKFLATDQDIFKRTGVLHRMKRNIFG